MPGSAVASGRRVLTSPATPPVNSATTSPNALRWIATFCPTLTLSFSLTAAGFLGAGYTAKNALDGRASFRRLAKKTESSRVSNTRRKSAQ